MAIKQIVEDIFEHMNVTPQVMCVMHILQVRIQDLVKGPQLLRPKVANVAE